MADNDAILLDDDLEADHLLATEYFFDRIGDPLPIKPSPFNFDPRNPPSQPLAVSELHGLIFVAHDSGSYCYFLSSCFCSLGHLLRINSNFDFRVLCCEDRGCFDFSVAALEELHRCMNVILQNVISQSVILQNVFWLRYAGNFFGLGSRLIDMTGMNRQIEIRRLYETQRMILHWMIPSSVVEISIVDVPLGEVRILVLSFDNSTLAASVGGEVHFFSVDLFLHEQELNPSFSRSLNESSNVKDIRWRTISDNSFLVLSEMGRLYHGNVDGYFENVMDKVDAVEWSIDGDYIVVAKENNLSILSSEFEEISCMVLLFNSWIGDSDANRTVKVDSIRWVRRDSIIVGCFQLTEDGREENYLVQVIRSNDGNFSDEPIVISCRDLFPNVVDDILPFGRGPYLLASYLEQCQLAIIANKKSTDQHIVYLGWSLGEGRDEVAVIDIERDTRLPRIELQENDDDNLILGMCTFRSRYNPALIFRPGGDIATPSSCCFLMCLTVEGKLVIFDVSRSP